VRGYDKAYQERKKERHTLGSKELKTHDRTNTEKLIDGENSLIMTLERKRYLFVRRLYLIGMLLSFGMKSSGSQLVNLEK